MSFAENVETFLIGCCIMCPGFSLFLLLARIYKKKMATLGLYYYPVYRYTYRGETYEQIGNVPAMEEQARKKVGTELTLFIDPAKPTSFYCLEEEKDYFQQRLAYLIAALLVIAVLIMIGVMWLTI